MPLKQDRAEEARWLLSKGEEHEFFSDFSLHSIGLLLFRRQYDVFRRFLADMFLNAGVGVVGLLVREAAGHQTS